MYVGFGLMTATRAIVSQPKLCLFDVTQDGVKVERVGETMSANTRWNWKTQNL